MLTLLLSVCFVVLFVCLVIWVCGGLGYVFCVWFVGVSGLFNWNLTLGWVVWGWYKTQILRLVLLF